MGHRKPRIAIQLERTDKIGACGTDPGMIGKARALAGIKPVGRCKAGLCIKSAIADMEERKGMLEMEMEELRWIRRQ